MKSVEERIKAGYKKRLQYAIKTKVFHEDKKVLLNKCLETSSQWNTFRKDNFLYKFGGYVAGAIFDSAAGEFCYYLTTSGTIIRRGGHTNWQRIF